MTSFSASADAPVGIFDSGVGGLSVLRHIRAQLPDEHLLYCADSGFAPYGDKPEHLVAQRVMTVAGFLVDQGAKALVVACNTATVCAIAALRERYPGMPIVGVEPGLKPAAAATQSGKVGVLATDATLAGEKFRTLMEQVSQASGTQFLLRGCTGLADQIELGELGWAATVEMLEKYVTPLLDQGADTLVLGCTHYPFVRDAIETIAVRHSGREITLVDTGDAVARQLRRLLDAAGLLRAPSGDATLTAYTSASATALHAAFDKLLGYSCTVRESPLP